MLIICCSPSIAQTLTIGAADTAPGDTQLPSPTSAEIQSLEHKKHVRPTSALHKKASSKRLVGRLPISPIETSPSQSGTESVSRTSSAPPWSKEKQSRAAEKHGTQQGADQPADQQHDGSSKHHHHRLSASASSVTGLLEQLKDWAYAERQRQKNRREKKAAKKTEHHRSVASSTEVDGAVEGDEFGEPLSLVSSGDEAAQVALDAFDALVAAAEASRLEEHSRRPSAHRKASRKKHARHASDTDYASDGEPVVPSCEEVLQTPEEVGMDEFKSQVLKLAHTLKCKGWRRVDLDRYKEVTVERISGAFTNVVSLFFTLVVYFYCSRPGTSHGSEERIKIDISEWRSGWHVAKICDCGLLSQHCRLTHKFRLR